MLLIDAVQPLSKQTDHAQTPRPALPICPAERLLPSQEEISADVFGALPFRKGDKSA
jgi:hypothetical protein